MMNSFKQYLQESQFNMTHLEDLVLVDKKSALYATSVIANMANDFSGTTDRKLNVTVKWDGSPAFIYGPHPENGRPFITTKGRILKKEPEVFQSVRELKASKLDPALVVILADLFIHLSKLKFKRILMGDLIFNRSMKGVDKIDGEAHITFTPNTITYAVPHGTPLGKRISKAKVGAIFHTSWSGKDLKSMKKKVETKIGNLGSSPDVFYDDATFKDVSGVAMFTKSEAKDFRKAMSAIKPAIGRLDHSILKPTLKMAFSKYFNSHLRGGKVPPVTVTDFIAKGDMSDKMKQHTLENQKKLQDIFDVFLTLGNFKLQLVRKLETIQSMKTFIRTKKGFDVTAPEGFVAIDRVGQTIKLVDRLTFTTQNFRRR